MAEPPFTTKQPVKGPLLLITLPDRVTRWSLSHSHSQTGLTHSLTSSRMSHRMSKRESRAAGRLMFSVGVSSTRAASKGL
jgi:hypothetical protein